MAKTHDITVGFGRPASASRLQTAKTAGNARFDPSTWALSRARSHKHAVLVAVQLAGEAVCVAMAVPVAYLMLESWPASLGPVQRTPANALPLLVRLLRSPEFSSFLPLLFLAPVIHLLFFQWFGLYQRTRGETRPFRAAVPILKGTVLGTGVLFLLGYAYRNAQGAAPIPYSALFFAYVACVVFLSVLLVHSATLIGVLCLRAWNIGRTRVAIIHADDKSPAPLVQALESPASEYALVGRIRATDAETQDGQDDQAHLGTLDDLPTLINRHDLDEVILAVDPATLSTEQRLTVARTCWRMGTGLKMVTPFHPFFHTSARPETLGGVSLLLVQNMGLYATVPQLLKRAMDITLSSAALIALSPLMLLIAAITKLTSKGPVFFVQERVGLNGRTFRMIKFRSMRADADEAIHKQYLQQLIRGDQAYGTDHNGKRVYKIKRDPRITRFGWFIRKTSLDELPQLFNVLRGEMSLVGPRPPIPYEVDEYQDWHMRRLHIRPGITGLWQVSGRNLLSFDQMVQLDISYIENWSLWLDMRILLKTIPVFLKISQGY